MMNWSVELSKFGVAYEPRGAIKAQALSDFVAELSPNQPALTNLVLILSVDGSSNMKGSGAGIVLEGPQEVLVEQSLRFEFRTSNKQAEYEAILAGMKLAAEMDVQELLVKSDSQLVINQIQGEYQTKDDMLLKSLSQVQNLCLKFLQVKFEHVPRERNSRADLLAKLASTKKPGCNKTVIQEIITLPSVNLIAVHNIEVSGTWMQPIVDFLVHNIKPADQLEARKLERQEASYTLLDGVLYRRGFTAPLLRCENEQESATIRREVHEGSCGYHIGGSILLSNILRDGY